MSISLHWVSRPSARAKIARLHLSRPDAHNAINFDAIDAFERHLDALEQVQDLCAVVLSTEGDATFISGGDLKAFHTLDTDEAVLSMSTRMKDLFRRFEALPAPIIAAIDGHAFGGGGELLLACDVRIMNQRATIRFSQLRFALSPGWGGGARLAQQTSRQRALYLLLSTNPLRAEDAERWGLVEQVCDGPALDEALQFAQSLQVKSLGAVRSLKRALRSPDDEQAVFLQLWSAPDHHHAVSAFLARSRNE